MRVPPTGSRGRVRSPAAVERSPPLLRRGGSVAVVAQQRHGDVRQGSQVGLKMGSRVIEIGRAHV